LASERLESRPDFRVRRAETLRVLLRQEDRHVEHLRQLHQPKRRLDDDPRPVDHVHQLPLKVDHDENAASRVEQLHSTPPWRHGAAA
jgi:hypothetical protein